MKIIKHRRTPTKIGEHMPKSYFHSDDIKAMETAAAPLGSQEPRQKQTPLGDGGNGTTNNTKTNAGYTTSPKVCLARWAVSAVVALSLGKRTLVVERVVQPFSDIWRKPCRGMTSGLVSVQSVLYSLIPVLWSYRMLWTIESFSALEISA